MYNYPLLKVDNISKAYGAKLLFKDLSFELHEGKHLGVVGKNGSGKSTLAKTLIKYTTFEKGEIYLNGNSIDEQDRITWSRQIQLISQYSRNSLDPSKLVLKILEEPLLLFHKIKGEKAKSKIIEVLELMQLDKEVLTKTPLQLSGGQYQRVCIAQALLVEPSVIICDEISANLDRITELKLLRELKNMEDVTFIVISHDSKVINYLCDDVIRIEDYK